MAIKYIPFYPHDFFNDPRVMELDIKEQQQWLFLLVRMMQAEAKLPEKPTTIGYFLGISPAAAKRLIDRLKTVGLLFASDTGNKLFTLSSRRMTREYDKAKTACKAASDNAKSRADRRWVEERKSKETPE
jgi:hypothetical protein